MRRKYGQSKRAFQAGNPFCTTFVHSTTQGRRMNAKFWGQNGAKIVKLMIGLASSVVAAAPAPRLRMPRARLGFADMLHEAAAG